MRTAVAAAGDEAFNLEQRIGGGCRRLLRLQILTVASNTVKDQASLNLVKHQEIHKLQPVVQEGGVGTSGVGRNMVGESALDPSCRSTPSTSGPVTNVSRERSFWRAETPCGHNQRSHEF